MVFDWIREYFCWDIPDAEKTYLLVKDLMTTINEFISRYSEDVAALKAATEATRTGVEAISVSLNNVKEYVAELKTLLETQVGALTEDQQIALAHLESSVEEATSQLQGVVDAQAEVVTAQDALTVDGSDVFPPATAKNFGTHGKDEG